MLSYIEINRENLIHNFRTFRKFVHPNTEIICVVKGNAYGHGLKEVVTILDSHAEMFGVNSLEELRSLRTISQKPVLVLGYISKEDLEEAVSLNATLGVYDIERIKLINDIGEQKGIKLKVHIKIDAALGRQGILLENLEDFVKQIKKLRHIEIEGLYAHFANIEDPDDFSHAQKQIDIFDMAVQTFKDHGFTDIKKHMSASSGILVYDKDTGKNNLVRLGISLYGMWPDEYLRKRQDKILLKPTLRWVSHIAQVKTLPAGHSIGYSLTYITSRPTTVAIIPQGYSDGYDRGLSNQGDVLIHGKKCRVLGRVMMNMIVADVSHLSDVKVEDEVVLLGSQDSSTISAEEIANKIGTINYEVTTRISPLLPRIIV